MKTIFGYTYQKLNKGGLLFQWGGIREKQKMNADLNVLDEHLNPSSKRTKDTGSGINTKFQGKSIYIDPKTGKTMLVQSSAYDSKNTDLANSYKGISSTGDLSAEDYKGSNKLNSLGQRVSGKANPLTDKLNQQRNKMHSGNPTMGNKVTTLANGEQQISNNGYEIGRMREMTQPDIEEEVAPEPSTKSQKTAKTVIVQGGTKQVPATNPVTGEPVFRNGKQVMITQTVPAMKQHFDADGNFLYETPVEQNSFTGMDKQRNKQQSEGIRKQPIKK